MTFYSEPIHSATEAAAYLTEHMLARQNVPDWVAAQNPPKGSMA